MERIVWDQEALDILWGVRESPKRGPRHSLTVDSIVAAAIDLADSEGLAAVSMKRVAEALGVGTMSLYTYVSDKATLLAVMVDKIFGEAELPAPSIGWRSYLEGAATTILDVYMAHPWTLQLNATGPPLAPNQVRYVETTLHALADTGLTLREQIDTTMAISYYVLGVAHLAGGILIAERESGLSRAEVDALHAAAYQRVLDPDEFPLTLVMMTGEPDEPALDTWDDFGFNYGLQRLLDGVGQVIESRQH